MKRSALGLVLVFGCGTEPLRVPARNLDRPTGVAFVCMKTDVEGAPYEPAAVQDCAADSDLPRQLFTLVANSTRGEVALFNVTDEQLVDLDSGTPTFQFAKVGELPHDIAAAEDGSRVVTANMGSCDLGVIDTTALIVADGVPPVSRLAIQSGGKRLDARVHSVVLRGDQAIVTLPNCGLVARVDMTSGELLESLALGEFGITRVDSPKCPSECDSGASPVEDSALPGALVLSAEGTTLGIAVEGAPYVAWVKLDGESGEFESFGRIVIEGTVGVSRVAISPATEFGEFIYAVANDGTVRVLSLELERECETNVDARALSDFVEPKVALCFPLDDPLYPRRALAKTPGIELAGDLAVDVSFRELHCCAEPDDDTCPDDPEREICADQVEEGNALSPIFYDGLYAFVLTSEGVVTVVDAGDEFSSARTEKGFRRDALPHSIRPIAVRNDVSCAAPKDGVIDYRWPTPSVSGVSIGYGNELLEPVDSEFPDLLDETPCPNECTEGEAGECVDECLADCETPEDDFGVSFPDPRSVETETVELVFEGVVPKSSRVGGRVGECDGDACLFDSGAAFCHLGIETGDVLELVGCDEDSDCDSLVQTCALDPTSPPGVGGLCVVRGREVDDLETCERLVRSRREYQITEVWQDRLVLALEPVPLHCDEESVCTDCLDSTKDNDCIRVCEADADCPGTVCEDVGSDHVCVAAPPLSRACFVSLARYQVRTGGAFRVSLGQDGEFFHRVVPDDDGRCVIDESKSGLLTSRISLKPSACEDRKAPLPNPCVDQARNLEETIHYANARYSFALRRVDKVPVRTPEATFFLRFGVEQPLGSLATSSGAFLGTRIVHGPDDFEYVIDSGDTVPSGGVRGQLLRYNPLRGTSEGVLR